MPRKTDLSEAEVFTAIRSLLASGIALLKDVVFQLNERLPPAPTSTKKK